MFIGKIKKFISNKKYSYSKVKKKKNFKFKVKLL
jgi:hypothetical protein